MGGVAHGRCLDRERPSLKPLRSIAGPKIAAVLGTEPVFPCEANAVFLRLPEQLAARLQECGWRFYKFIEPDVYRLMCAWSTTEQQIDAFVADLAKSLAANKNGDKYTA